MFQCTKLSFAAGVSTCLLIVVYMFTCESCWFSNSAILVVGGDDALPWTLRTRQH